jgi:CPA1 family monovalent cation:H+ antiporter
MATLVLILMVLLAMGFVGTQVASYLRLPHSIFLVALGVLSGMLLRGVHDEHTLNLIKIFPEVVVVILLPILIFDAAYDMEISEFRTDFGQIMGLATVGLGISTFIIGYLIHYFLKFDLFPSLTFGALISATDPISIVALFREIGIPKRLQNIVEGESLLNDATAFVMFQVLVGITMNTTSSSNIIGPAIGHFLTILLGGILLGLVLAYAISLLLKFVSVSGSAQLGITVVAAFVSFLAAENIFHVSGIMTTITVGLYLGSRARTKFNKDALTGMRYIWGFLALSANIIVFFAVGVTVEPSVLLLSAKFILPTIAIVYLARSISVFATVSILNRIKWINKISGLYQIVLAWGGLRGGLALGLVLTLPETFPYKNIFVSLAISVVLATLFVNALTTRKLLQKLKLDRLNLDDEKFYYKTVELIQEKIFTPLNSLARNGIISSDLVESKKLQSLKIFLDGHIQFISQMLKNDDADLKFAMATVLLREKQYYDKKLEDKILSNLSYYHLIRFVDERIIFYKQEQFQELKDYHFEFPKSKNFQTIIARWIKPIHDQQLIQRLAIELEVILNMKLALISVSNDVAHPKVKEIVLSWEGQANHKLEEFYKLYPLYSSAAQMHYVSTSLYAGAMAEATELRNFLIIGQPVFSRVSEKIQKILNESVAESVQLFDPKKTELLSNVPLFQDFSKEAIEALSKMAKVKVFPKGKVIAVKGEKINSFILITAGKAEVINNLSDNTALKLEIISGDSFGEMSLLFNKPNTDTVRAILDTEAIEIDRNIIRNFLRDFPSCKQKLYSRGIKLRSKQDHNIYF